MTFVVILPPSPSASKVKSLKQKINKNITGCEIVKSSSALDGLTEVLQLLLWDQDFDIGHEPLQGLINNRLYSKLNLVWMYVCLLPKPL